MKSTTKIVLAKCPVCNAMVPMFTITAQVSGLLNPKVGLVVEADASDYVAHMWGHSQGEPAWQ